MSKSINWRWVPVEATEEMLQAAAHALLKASGGDLEACSWELEPVLKAAFAAAPHHPIAQPDVLRAAAEKARAALSDLLLKRDPIVYSDALRALDEALAQAPIAQPQAAGWRPISEAPRDGTPVWVKGVNWGDINRGHHCCWAYWNGERWLAGAPGYECHLEHLLYWMPLPWQPLPEPPKEGA